MLSSGLTRAVRAHKLHKLLQGVLPVVVVVADGRVCKVRAGLLNDGRGGEVQGGCCGPGAPWSDSSKHRQRVVGESHAWGAALRGEGAAEVQFS